MTLLLMTYPADALFDIETLVNVAQAERILLLGNVDASFLDNYTQQKSVLNQTVDITHLNASEMEQFWQLQERFDVAIVADLFEHIDKAKGRRVLSRLRDLLCPQYCICLPIVNSASESAWHLTDLFSFALSRVANYHHQAIKYGLFKYNINDYKKTPDWLNADNWANPQMWGKYWW